MEPEEVTTQHIEYTRTIVPSSMRSPYWKYFGFPSDNSNNILTKLKIICTLCNTAIAYNKNTSNLRTHLVARHPDLLTEIQNQRKRGNEHMISSNNVENKQLNDGNLIKQKRSKTLLYLNSNNIDQSNLPLATFIPSNTSHTNKPHTIIEEDEDEEPEVVANNGKIPGSAEDFEDYASTLNPDDQNYTFENLDDTTIKASSTSDTTLLPLEDLVTDMLITDILPLSVVDGTGFLRLLWNYGGSTPIIQKNSVEQNLLKMYHRDLNKIENYVKAMSQFSPFSISIEAYSNVEKKNLLCIYINFILPQTNDLQCVLYRTVESELNGYTDFSDIFSNLNLKKCACVIVNSDNQILETFLNSHNIPIIPCFENVIYRTMCAIFQLDTIHAAYTKISKLVEKYRNDESFTLSDSIPDVVEDNPWSKYNFLQFVQDHISLNLKDDDDSYSSSLETVMQLLKFLNPFKITLETISEEPLPLCSLMRPLTIKLLEEHFSPYISQNDYITEVRNVLTDELTISILSNSFLNEATFFDPRFQHDFVEYDTGDAVIKKSVSDRYRHLFAADGEFEDRKVKTEDPTAVPARKSSLTFFFNRSNGQTATQSIVRKRSLDWEISKYRNELLVDLEQCPISWWEVNAFNYKQLKQISDYYMVVPCCVNRLFKYTITDRIEATCKRYMLPKRMATHLWFLHYNKEIILKLKNDYSAATYNT